MLDATLVSGRQAAKDFALFVRDFTSSMVEPEDFCSVLHGLLSHLRYDPTDPKMTDKYIREVWSSGAATYATRESLRVYAATMKTIVDQLDLLNAERVVSLGCGPGLYECFLAALLKATGSATEVLAIDSSVQMIHELNKVRSTMFVPSTRSALFIPIDNVRGVTGDMRSIPLRAELADIIICNNALHWSRHWHDAVVEMLRVVRPGGQVFITVPSCSVSTRFLDETVLSIDEVDVDDLCEALESDGCSIRSLCRITGPSSDGPNSYDVNRTCIVATLGTTLCSWRDDLPEIETVDLTTREFAEL